MISAMHTLELTTEASTFPAHLTAFTCFRILAEST